MLGLWRFAKLRTCGLLRRQENFSLPVRIYRSDLIVNNNKLRLRLCSNDPVIFCVSAVTFLVMGVSTVGYVLLAFKAIHEKRKVKHSILTKMHEADRSDLFFGGRV